MKLNKDAIKNKTAWEAAGISLPDFDYEAMLTYTKEHPVWVHFGAGNIFRGFIARLQQKLLDEGLTKSGIVAADTFDFDIIDKIYAAHDNLAILVSLKADGNADKEVVASISEGLRANSADTEHMGRLKEIFRNQELQMVSFTITEKGYSLANIKGERLTVVEKDITDGPDKAVHATSIVTALMLERFKAGAYPVALVSMDNCSHNGDKLKSAVLEIAEAWTDKGFADKAFVEYLSDGSKVSFPWSMIDKITPRPDKQIQEDLEKSGIEGMEPVVTSKNTYIAPFVNAEVPEYLVVEDSFPNGRPPLEKAGVYFTNRETVDNTERMKVTTCLNPLHTALAVFGCLLGYNRISDEMRDSELKALVELIGYKEGLPVVVNPGIIDPKAFLQEVLEVRLPNPFIPDMPQRIATDTSQKIVIRFGETIKSYIADTNLNVDSLTGIPLAIAGWLRYLLAVDDEGKVMEISGDPMLEQLRQQLSGIEVGNPSSYNGQLKELLSNKALFASDLCACGLSGKIEGMFTEMLQGKGAVRSTLRKYIMK